MSYLVPNLSLQNNKSGSINSYLVGILSGLCLSIKNKSESE